MIWIDRVDQIDRLQNTPRDIAPADLAKTVKQLQQFPRDQRSGIAWAMSSPGKQFFVRDIAGLHPLDERNLAAEQRALAWMRSKGVGLSVAEIRIAHRTFNELPASPPGILGDRSPILSLGTKPRTVLRTNINIVPTWVTGDWSGLDPTVVPTSDPLTGPPRPALGTRPPEALLSVERNGSATVRTVAIRLEGQSEWTTLYRLNRKPPLNLSFAKIGMSLFGILVLGFLAVVIGRRMTGALRDLTQGAEALSRGDRPPIVEERGARDLRDIARASNKMNERVGQTADYQIGLLRSLGHDLKGPLAAVERLLKDVHPDDTRHQIETRLQRAQAIIDSIMAFSRDAMRDGPVERTVWRECCNL